MKYRKKVLVDAVQFRGGEQPGELAADVVAGKVLYPEDGTMLIQTLEGVMVARPGDWVLRGPEGELWPVRADIFEKTYEPAEGASRSPRPACSCGAASEPDYSNGDHDEACPAKEARA